MKPVHPIAAGIVGTVILLLVGGGCRHSTGTDHDAASASGAKYLLDAEPAAAQSVVDVRALLEEKKTPTDVVVVGRISGLGQPTWDPERAAFMVADLSLALEEEAAKAEHDETPKHDAENCPYLSRREDRRNWPDWLLFRWSTRTDRSRQSMPANCSGCEKGKPSSCVDKVRLTSWGPSSCGRVASM